MVELMPPTDSLAALQSKMVEYLDNGARLGWLIQPEAKRVYVHRPGAAVEELKDPTFMSGDPELPGFTLDLQEIWNPNI
jgi:Uma2 family endonuclease